MNASPSPFKSAVILCIPLLFSLQTHGAEKWREKVSRHLPWSAAYKLEKKEKQRRKKFVKKLNSMNTHELVALDSELKSESYDVGTIKEMKALARQETYARVNQNEKGEILEILARDLKARLASALNDEKTAPHFFEIFQDTARGNPPRAYRNILQEFFFAHADEIMALEPGPEEIRVLNETIYSFNASIKILQATLDKAESADTFLAAFDAVAIPAPHRKNRETLNHFLDLNSGKLGKLLSPKQAQMMDTYINRNWYGVHEEKEMLIKNRSGTPNARNAWRYLHYIADRGKLFVTFLKTWPQYLTLVDEKTGDNLLHLVARYGGRETSTEMGAFLVEAGLKLDAKNKAGETALFIIGARDIFSPLFDYLKEKGAKANTADSNGNTILHHFVFKDLPPSPHIERAIDAGISPYQKNNRGWSSLMLYEKSRSFSHATQDMKKWWRRYIEENSDVPPDDNLHLAHMEGRGQKLSKASRCRRWISVLLRRRSKTDHVTLEGGSSLEI